MTRFYGILVNSDSDFGLKITYMFPLQEFYSNSFENVSQPVCLSETNSCLVSNL